MVYKEGLTNVINASGGYSPFALCVCAMIICTNDLCTRRKDLRMAEIELTQCHAFTQGIIIKLRQEL